MILFHSKTKAPGPCTVLGKWKVLKKRVIDPKKFPSAHRETNITRPYALSFVLLFARAQEVWCLRHDSWLCLSTYHRACFHWDLPHIPPLSSGSSCMAVPLKQPITREVWAHCDLYPSHLLEGAVVQLHICMSIEPYSILHSLLTAAYGKAIFHKVCERKRDRLNHHLEETAALKQDWWRIRNRIGSR